jgi:hydrogenase small subunit
MFGAPLPGQKNTIAIYTNLPIEKPTAPMAYPGTQEPQGKASWVAAGVAGLAIGAAVGVGVMASKKLSKEEEK